MLAERIASVTIAHPCGFAVKIEGVLGSAAVEKVDRALLMGIESIELGGIAHGRKILRGLKQVAAVSQLAGRNAFGRVKRTHAIAGCGGVVVVFAAEQHRGVGHAKVTAGEVRVIFRRRAAAEFLQPHMIGNACLGRAQLGDHRAKAGIVDGRVFATGQQHGIGRFMGGFLVGH